jgi:imidazolonepropionase-like amidohydrolase
MILIKNAHLKTITNGDVENGCILIGDDGKLAAVGKDIDAPEGVEIIDADGRLVTPGLVEAHCHIGGTEPMIGWAGSDINEGTDPITPQLRIIDGINPMSPDFENARRGGVTAVCVAPGSANIIGGTAIAIKTYGNRVDDMVIKDPVAMKCAFGENPKNVYGQQLKKAPKTRMAIAALFREYLTRARQYAADKDAGKDVKFDPKLEALVPVVKGELPLKAHAHRTDDIFTAIRIAKEFNLKMTLDHCTYGHLIADRLAEEGYPALVGPSFGGRSKSELEHKCFETAGVLNKAGVEISIITDATVTPIENLSTFAGMAVANGLPYEEAWKAITVNPARALGILDRVGSLEVGKDADVVIWTADPLTTIGAKAHLTIIDGKVR